MFLGLENCITKFVHLTTSIKLYNAAEIHKTRCKLKPQAKTRFLAKLPHENRKSEEQIAINSFGLAMTAQVGAETKLLHIYL